MAERGGFEPPIRLPVCRISSAVHSTTLPPLQVPDARWSRAGAVIAACVARDKGSGGDISDRLVDFPAAIAYPPMVPKSALALLDAPALAARDAFPLGDALRGSCGFTGSGIFDTAGLKSPPRAMRSHTDWQKDGRHPKFPWTDRAGTNMKG